MSPRHALLTAILTSAALAAGCTPTVDNASGNSSEGALAPQKVGLGEACAASSECISGLVCINGVCAPSTPYVCSDLIDCGNTCATAACVTKCEHAGTASARAKYDALGACVDAACPLRAGAVCERDATGEPRDQAKCNLCVSSAQQTGGACAAKLNECSADAAPGALGQPCTPAGLCNTGLVCSTSKTCIVSATDSCSEVVSCGNACTTQACLTACKQKGTSSAKTLYETLGACIDAACPSTVGAVCAFDIATGLLNDRLLCDQCVADSQANGGDCKPELTACEADGT